MEIRDNDQTQQSQNGKKGKRGQYPGQPVFLASISDPGGDGKSKRPDWIGPDSYHNRPGFRRYSRVEGHDG